MDYQAKSPAVLINISIQSIRGPRIYFYKTYFQCARYLTVTYESEKADVRSQLLLYIHNEIQGIVRINPNTANSYEPRAIALVYPK
jgi:hypothetical protein